MYMYICIINSDNVHVHNLLHIKATLKPPLVFVQCGFDELVLLDILIEMEIQ